VNIEYAEGLPRISLELAPMSARLLRPLLALLLLASGATWADGKGGHHHHSPHGGQVQDAGNVHLEAVVKDSKFLLYILDANEKTLPPPAEGTVKLAVGKQIHDLMLKPEGEALSAALPAGAEGKALVAVVVVKLESGLETVRFKLGEKKAHPHHHEHAHPEAVKK
jgi:hypothetical protein